MEETAAEAQPIELDLSDSEAAEEELEEEEEPQLDPHTKGDLLFCAQNLGFTKIVERTEIYVKKEGCLELLKELYKLLRTDNLDSYLRRVEIGRWNVIESDLSRLIVNYPEDKQLAFYVLVLMVTLTDKPDKDHLSDPIYTEILQNYKTTFVTRSGLIEALVKLIVYCLTIDPALKNERHDQMLELIIYLIRNLVAIPDRQMGIKKGKKGFFMVNSKEDHYSDLQRRLLHVLANSLVLEAVIFIAQDFKSATIQKLNFCLIEIFYHIIKHFKPEQLFAASNSQQLTDLLAQDKAEKRAKMHSASSRHSKFGSNYREARQFNGTYSFSGGCITSNAFQQLLDRSHVPSQIQPVKPRIPDSLKTLPDTQNLSITMDSALVAKVRKMCEDVLNQCYCSIVETVFAELYRDSDRLEAEDKVHYFVFQAFFLEFARRKYYQDRVEPYNFDVSCISESLKIENFEYLFKCFIAEFSKTSKKEYNAREFHSALKFCLQFLYCIKEMSDSDNEEIKKNSQILLQNVFYHEISAVCSKAFSYWKDGVSQLSFLTDIVQFTHVAFKLLEDYSRGKALTVQTTRLARRKIRREYEENEEFPLSDQEDDQSESIYRERQLNFSAEFSFLADPEIIRKYCVLVRNLRLNSQFTNECIAKFLQRIMQECDADWLLFQLDYMREFYAVLGNRENERMFPELYATLRLATKRFFALFQRNSVLPIEALFRFKDKLVVNDILSNYESAYPIDSEPLPEAIEEESGPVLPSSLGLSWSKEEDLLLLENYYTFKDMERVCEVLSDMLQDRRKGAEAVSARLKLLKVGKGLKTAREIVEELHSLDEIYSLSRTGPRAYRVIGKETCLALLERIQTQYAAYQAEFPAGEMAWVPTTPEEFEAMGKVEFLEMLASAGARMPGRGEWMVRFSQSLHEVIEQMRGMDLRDAEEADNPSEEEAEYSAHALDAYLTKEKTAERPNEAAVDMHVEETVTMPGSLDLQTAENVPADLSAGQVTSTNEVS